MKSFNKMILPDMVCIFYLHVIGLMVPCFDLGLEIDIYSIQ